MGESVDGRWPPPLKTFDVINKNKEAFLRLSANSQPMDEKSRPTRAVSERELLRVLRVVDT